MFIKNFFTLLLSLAALHHRRRRLPTRVIDDLRFLSRNIIRFENKIYSLARPLTALSVGRPQKQGVSLLSSPPV